MIKSNENGITLITLVVMVALLVIITASMVVNIDMSWELSDLTKLDNDIKALNDRVAAYYVQNNELPVTDKIYTKSQLKDIITDLSENDGSRYYLIDLEKLDNITLNYGSQYKTTSFDKYIINKQSHMIYYMNGIEYKGQIYHTTERDGEVISHIPAYTAPTIASISATADRLGKITVTATADDESKVSSKEYSLDETTWQTSNEFQVNDTGTYTVYARVSDSRGNTNSGNTSVTVEIKYLITARWALNVLFTEEVAKGSTMNLNELDYRISAPYILANNIDATWGDGDNDEIGWFYDSMLLNSISTGDAINGDIDVYLGFELGYMGWQGEIIMQKKSTYNSLGLTPIESDIFEEYEEGYGCDVDR